MPPGSRLQHAARLAADRHPARRHLQPPPAPAPAVGACRATAARLWRPAGRCWPGLAAALRPASWRSSLSLAALPLPAPACPCLPHSPLHRPPKWFCVSYFFFFPFFLCSCATRASQAHCRPSGLSLRWVGCGAALRWLHPAGQEVPGGQRLAGQEAPKEPEPGACVCRIHPHAYTQPHTPHTHLHTHTRAVQVTGLSLRDNGRLTGPAFPPAWLARGGMRCLRWLHLNGNPGLTAAPPAGLPWPNLAEL